MKQEQSKYEGNFAGSQHSENMRLNKYIKKNPWGNRALLYENKNPCQNTPNQKVESKDEKIRTYNLKLNCLPLLLHGSNFL